MNRTGFVLHAPFFTLVLTLASLASCSSAELNRLKQLAEASVTQLEGEIQLSGLQQDVEILRDEWGVAHIYATDVDDLFFAQGFVAAQDRLWQLEIWRRVGEGRLAEIVGPSAFERDRLARLLKYRGDMEAEWAAYHPEGERIISAFVRGVNAFIEHSGDNPPVEFKLTGLRAEPWSVEVPLLRMAGLPMTQNALDEIRLVHEINEHGLSEANRRDNPDPWQELQVPRGLDLTTIPNEVEHILSAGYAPTPRIMVSPPFRALTEAVESATPAGSNNWTVSGAMTATGQPILANDPHRRISLPSLRYLVHLNGPGWNVIGSGEPALPGVAIGHNERIAWGLTIVGIDQQDVFVEHLNPNNHNEVRWRGQWEPLTVEFDTIVIRGEGPREIQLKFSRHGPIIYEDTTNNLAYAFRSVLAEPGTAGYLASLRVDQAQNWEEFLDAMDHWLVPSENMVYADVDGNIGWQAAGLTPVRCCGAWVGRLPAPGTGQYAWRRFRPMSELPREYNPERGYITTANHNIMPLGYSPPLGYNWSSPVRYQRLDDILSDSGGFTVDDFKRLQHDVYSSVAKARVTHLEGWTAVDEDVERAREMLVEWNGKLGRDVPEAALFKTWERFFTSHDDWQESNNDSLAQMALAMAIDTLETNLGRDWTTWRWGALHKARFEHPITAAYDLPAVERGGDFTTVNLSAQWGASFREIIDLSDWDNSVATNVPGQSGQPESPHYSDLLDMWARGEYFPLVFTRDAVEQSTAHRLVLKPRE